VDFATCLSSCKYNTCVIWKYFISGKKKSKNKKGGDKDFVSLSDIFGANLKRKKTSSDTEEGLCLGMCTLWTENHWAIS